MDYTTLTAHPSRGVHLSACLFISVCVFRHCAMALQPFKGPGMTIDVSQVFTASALKETTDTTPHPTHVVNAQMLSSDTRRILSASIGNQIISDRLCSGERFIVARGGDAELLIVEDLLQGTIPRARQWPRRHSGIYPETDTGLTDFGDLYYEALRSLREPDVFAFFRHRRDVEDVVLKQTLSKSVAMIHEDSLSPFWFDTPWSSCLRNKVVLIVHPFIDSIKCQLRRRSHIFPNSVDTLPPFEAKFVKSFQCMGEEPLPHRDWNETMHATMRLVDEVGHFDVALIAAGSYGLPLAVYCKYTKKASAVVIGGGLQQLFGLRGMRWEKLYPTGYKYQTLHNATRPTMYNENWMFPLRSDTITNPSKIEHGSPYWGPPNMQLDACPV
jgi:hypothetical protein